MFSKHRLETSTMIIKKLIVILLCFFIAVSQAAEELAPLTEVWKITVSEENREFFEEVLKEHMQFRDEKGDPQQWSVYTPIIGEELNTYQIRSCCTDWIEIEENTGWAKSVKTEDHWRNNVAPFVSKIHHYYYHFNAKNSNWDVGQYNYFAVQTITPIPSKVFQLQTAIESMSLAAKEMGVSFSWGWFNRIGGAPEIELVVGYQTLADMMPVNQSFYEQLSVYLNSKGDAKSLLEQYAESFSESHYSIVILREDLSSQKIIYDN